ncbi:MAG: hypothetical protein AVDCRST_MAG14-894 [uncultured Rubrobacteraceae bacterium]|uniref:Uncharacterized protein n=1 Tax=uncultured Rubrobacteraceae bacterium TaxID=349277 RepID=A0A6J4QPC8_9ACTN|nr:MAG: hypothetical protein AVDCRST_MAG14-894 [uncultured Rubrobacteraceae bacterium]
MRGSDRAYDSGNEGEEGVLILGLGLVLPRLREMRVAKCSPRSL